MFSVVCVLSRLWLLVDMKRSLYQQRRRKTGTLKTERRRTVKNEEMGIQKDFSLIFPYLGFFPRPGLIFETKISLFKVFQIQTGRIMQKGKEKGGGAMGQRVMRRKILRKKPGKVGKIKHRGHILIVGITCATKP